jgi:hypothetical protein
MVELCKKKGSVPYHRDVRRIELLVFAFAWISYAYFHQGGGWNQNGRFALTRALVEKQEPWIDDYLVYAANGPKGSPGLRRLPVRNGCFSDANRTFALAWSTPGGVRRPLAPAPPPEARLVSVDGATATGDLAFARGHTHPNKAPGASFLAVPGYALVFGLERSLGVDPDSALVVNVNAWLSGVLSVGLLSALGVVLFLRLALRFSEGRRDAAVFATLAFAFGTLYFPYATMLYEHNLVAVFLLGAFLLTLEPQRPLRLFAAGICAGSAVVSSYLAVVGLAILGVYVLWRGRRLSGVVAFAAGTIPPLTLLAAYNVACFGTLLTTNYVWQNPLFEQAGGGVLFGAPRWGVLLALSISPFRGLFSGTPVLVLGVVGLVAMLRQPRLRPEGVVCAAMIAHNFLFNMSFTTWMAGWACGPRYLVPALPFLALPIVFVSPGARWVRYALLAASIVAMALVTIVDAQPPATTTATWTVSPIWNIDLPQLLNGKPGSYARATWPDAFLAQRTEFVSVNTGEIYEATSGRFFPPDSPQARWSSFNAGEILFPGSRLSVLPWLALASAFVMLLLFRRSSP